MTSWVGAKSVIKVRIMEVFFYNYARITAKGVLYQVPILHIENHDVLLFCSKSFSRKIFFYIEILLRITDGREVVTPLGLVKSGYVVFNIRVVTVEKKKNLLSRRGRKAVRREGRSL